MVTRPAGLPNRGDFALVERPVAPAAEGEIQVQNLWMSVDPYMRPLLSAEQPLHAPLSGGGIGRVTHSRNPRFKTGALVRHAAGFREVFNADGRELSGLRPDPDLPLSVYLHALGSTGMTAYGGLLEVGRLKAGEQVFVSTAAGAVGSVAAQIAKIKGCYVVGSTGADDKVDWLLDHAGLDAAFNYKTAPIPASLDRLLPQGIDVYFENVGGDHLEAALPRMNPRGRIPLCGMISTYNQSIQPIGGLPAMIYLRVLMQGFVSTDFQHLSAAFTADMTNWLKDGRLQYQETVLQGIERTAEALIGLFHGVNRGKMLLHLAD